MAIAQGCPVKPGQLMYGNGCRHHDDCFTCPFLDCKFSYGSDGKYLKYIGGVRKKARENKLAQSVGVTVVGKSTA